MRIICEYFEDALIFIDFDNKTKFGNVPYLVVKMDCYDSEDYLKLDTFEWENNSLDKEWSNEIISWAKMHEQEILNIWETGDVKLISERWNT